MFGTKGSDVLEYLHDINCLTLSSNSTGQKSQHYDYFSLYQPQIVEVLDNIDKQMKIKRSQRNTRGRQAFNVYRHPLHSSYTGLITPDDRVFLNKLSKKLERGVVATFDGGSFALQREGAVFEGQDREFFCGCSSYDTNNLVEQEPPQVFTQVFQSAPLIPFCPAQTENEEDVPTMAQLFVQQAVFNARIKLRDIAYIKQ